MPFEVLTRRLPGAPLGHQPLRNPTKQPQPLTTEMLITPGDGPAKPEYLGPRLFFASRGSSVRVRSAPQTKPEKLGLCEVKFQGAVAGELRRGPTGAPEKRPCFLNGACAEPPNHINIDYRQRSVFGSGPV